MSSTDRLKQYANPMKGPHGAASAPENIDYWISRATENSKIAPRASDGQMKLPNTGKQMNTRDTGMKPYARRGDARAEAKADLNYVGPFMRDVRRGA